ncbi:hypothetical protein [Paenibacillus germinis]|uniref:hypothetical protein n=1 Tax=Paenibacillus germinis TaxID=2654979 RepID=UPI001491EC11|nr:hypothetical protein [Paenibacillus germinis]
MKQIIENEHGVGQTIVEGFMRTTNLIVPTGIMLNLAQSGGGGNPVETMDLGFALQ